MRSAIHLSFLTDVVENCPFLARAPALSLQAPMTDGTFAATLTDPPKLFLLAGRRGPTPIADASEPHAEQVPRARCLPELDADRDRRAQHYHGRRQPQAASRRGSPPRRRGWSHPSADSHSRKDAHRERTVTHTQEASIENRPKKRCFAFPSGGSACRHSAVKVFPTGPRDNGEVYWQCAYCGTDL